MNPENIEKTKGFRRDKMIALRVTSQEKLLIGRLAFEHERSECWIVRDALKKAGLLPAEVSSNGTAKK
jgi:hypothetical protein